MPPVSLRWASTSAHWHPPRSRTVNHLVERIPVVNIDVRRRVRRSPFRVAAGTDASDFPFPPAARARRPRQTLKGLHRRGPPAASPDSAPGHRDSASSSFKCRHSRRRMAQPYQSAGCLHQPAASAENLVDRIAIAAADAAGTRLGYLIIRASRRVKVPPSSRQSLPLSACTWMSARTSESSAFVHVGSVAVAGAQSSLRDVECRKTVIRLFGRVSRSRASLGRPGSFPQDRGGRNRPRHGLALHDRTRNGRALRTCDVFHHDSGCGYSGLSAVVVPTAGLNVRTAADPKSMVTYEAPGGSRHSPAPPLVVNGNYLVASDTRQLGPGPVPEVRLAGLG